MKIMTFNTQHCLNFISRKIDFDKVADEILFHKADIAGLNEMRGKGLLKDYIDQTKKLSQLTGMNYYFGRAILVGGIAPYGNALLSRYPVLSAETIIIPDPKKKTGHNSYETRCIIKAVIDAGEKYTVIITHMGLNEDERINAVNTLLATAPRERCIIMGDFNCTPEGEELKRLFEEYNCSDVEDFTFPSDNPQRKIDYIFTSKDIVLSDKGTSENVVSDHKSQWIEIKE